MEREKAETGTVEKVASNIAYGATYLAEGVLAVEATIKTFENRPLFNILLMLGGAVAGLEAIRWVRSRVADDALKRGYDLINNRYDKTDIDS